MQVAVLRKSDVTPAKYTYFELFFENLMLHLLNTLILSYFFSMKASLLRLLWPVRPSKVVQAYDTLKRGTSSWLYLSI